MFRMDKPKGPPRRNDRGVLIEVDHEKTFKIINLGPNTFRHDGQ